MLFYILIHCCSAFTFYDVISLVFFLCNGKTTYLIFIWFHSYMIEILDLRPTLIAKFTCPYAYIQRRLRIVLANMENNNKSSTFTELSLFQVVRFYQSFIYLFAKDRLWLTLEIEVDSQSDECDRSFVLSSIYEGIQNYVVVSDTYQ